MAVGAGQRTGQTAALLHQLLYVTIFCMKFQFRPVHMLCQWPRSTSFFGITKGIYAERTGNQKPTERISGTSGGVTRLSKDGSSSLLTYKAKGGKLHFPGADLALFLLVLPTDQ